jgi:hypothetical protein
MERRIFVLACCLLAFSFATPALPPACAQSYDYYNVVIDNSMASSQLSQSIFNDIMAGEMTREALKSSARTRTPKGGSRPPSGRPSGSPKGPGGGGSGGSGGGTTTTGSTTFRPSGGSILPAKLSRDLAKTPAQQKEFERFFKSLLDTYSDLLREKRAPQNDVARAASFAVANSYSVFNGGRLLSGEQVQGLREQVHDAFARSAKFQALSDQRKQELFEGYAIIGMYVSAIYDGATKHGNKDVAEQMKKIAQTQLEETFGTPAERLKFTNAGVEF